MDDKSALRFASHAHSVAEKPTAPGLSANDTHLAEPDTEWSVDDELLAALGYKPEFRREFNIFTVFGVSFATLGLLPSFAATLYYGMGYAGTAGMVWGWLLAVIGIQAVASSMAELCSSMPTSGGLYYAAAVLAPPGWGPLASWITGWSNFFSQLSGTPSIDYGNAALILASASIQNPDYVPTAYHTYLLSVLLVVTHACMASIPTRWIARVNSFGSIINFAALIAVIILIPTATNRAAQGLSRFSPSDQVWGTIYHGTDFPAGVSVLMSFVAPIWTMSGYDSPFHLAEECSNANIAAPRAIFMTGAIGSVFGWFLQMVVAYTVIDIGAALESELGQPFAAYLQQVLPQSVVLAVLSLTIVTGFFMGQASMIASSRVTFAYARDGCFPFSKVWSRVNRFTRTPVNAVWLDAAIGVLLLLLIFGGPLAVAAIFSIGACASFVSFAIPIFIRVFLVGNRFRPGPWNLGRYSRPIGAVACGFVLLMVPILCLPTLTGVDLTLQTMNWTCVVYGGPMTLISIWWVLSARKWFHGPKINLNHAIHGTLENL